MSAVASDTQRPASRPVPGAIGDRRRQKCAEAPPDAIPWIRPGFCPIHSRSEAEILARLRFTGLERRQKSFVTQIDLEGEEAEPAAVVDRQHDALASSDHARLM